MPKNRITGGRQRSDAKSWEYFECACCKSKQSKRKTNYLGTDADGKAVRVCKSHGIKADSPGVDKIVS